MAGGEETCGKVSKGFSADGRGPAEPLRKHRGVGKGTRHRRRLLYTWREQLEPVETPEGPRLPANSREATLRKEVSRLKRLLAEKVLEVDFFKGALQQVEARRQGRGTAGAQASTPTSGT